MRAGSEPPVMTDDVDDVVDQLTVVTSGEALDSIPITDVSESETAVRLRLRLPSGDTFDETVSKPPVWGSNCDLKTLLDAFDLAPDSIDRLEGVSVPCDREITDTGIDFEIDFEELAGN